MGWIRLSGARRGHHPRGRVPQIAGTIGVDHLGGLEIDVIGFDRSFALAAAALRRPVPRSLSLGDRACLALGVATGATMLTADSRWRDQQFEGVTIVAIR